jgi:tight adherence protein C
MIWISAIAFAASLVVVMALFYAFSTGESAVTGRLSRLTQAQALPGVAETRFREKQKERIERVLTDVGKLLPSSTAQLSRTHRMMIRAGFRRPEAVQIMRGMMVVLPVGLFCLVYFTGFYHFSPMLILAAAPILGFLFPEIWLTGRIRRRQRRIVLAMPDALDLLVVCVEAGLGLDQAMLRVSQEIMLAHHELSDELQLVNLEMRLGKSRIEALRELGVRTGVEDLKTLVAMLIQTDRFGTDLTQSLRVHSEKMRIQRRQRAEEQAAKVSVKMVPPLVFFIFPALFVVILGPAVITLVRTFFPIANQ